MLVYPDGGPRCAGPVWRRGEVRCLLVRFLACLVAIAHLDDVLQDWILTEKPAAHLVHTLYTLCMYRCAAKCPLEDYHIAFGGPCFGIGDCFVDLIKGPCAGNKFVQFQAALSVEIDHPRDVAFDDHVAHFGADHALT
jgi:hypothetical protein